MPDLPDSSSPQPVGWLQHGQDSEAAGRFNEAIAAYDRAIGLLGSDMSELDPANRRLLGLVWMNRGNALQKNASASPLSEAVGSYDKALAAFQTLPFHSEPAFRNHLGAAWLNRGHALAMSGNTEAAESFERAIAHLEKLPIDADPHYRLNLAGAWTNLAHVLLTPASLSARERARSAAHSALGILAEVERAHELFAAMSLRARRALVMAVGDLLSAAEKTLQPLVDLATEATDAIDDGLAIARDFERRGIAQLRPLAARLFRLGAHLYGVHQPQFLGEFLIENLAAPSFGADSEFQAIATDSITETLAKLQRPQLLIAGMREAEKLIATARTLRAAQTQLSTLVPRSSTALSFA